MSAGCHHDPATVHEGVARLMETVGCDAGAVALVLTGGCNPDEIGTVQQSIDRAANGIALGTAQRAVVVTLRTIVGAVMAGETERAADGLDVWTRTRCAACARMATVGVVGRCSYCQGRALDGAVTAGAES